MQDLKTNFQVLHFPFLHFQSHVFRSHIFSASVSKVYDFDTVIDIFDQFMFKLVHYTDHSLHFLLPKNVPPNVLGN